VLTPELVRAHFGVAAAVTTHPGTGRHQLLFSRITEPVIPAQR
jgi:hypothetical protein